MSKQREIIDRWVAERGQNLASVVVALTAPIDTDQLAAALFPKRRRKKAGQKERGNG